MDKQTLLLLLRVASGIRRAHVTWREYVTQGPADFSAFTDTAGKAWQWTIRTYPAPDTGR